MQIYPKTFLHDSSQSRQSCKGIRIPESLENFIVESGILGCGIWNTVQGIWNPNNAWNPESKFYWQRLESKGVESRVSQSIVLQETDQVVEDFSLDYGNQKLTLNNKTGNSNLPATQFNNKQSVKLSYFWKCWLKDRGWFWEFSLVQISTNLGFWDTTLLPLPWANILP